MRAVILISAVVLVLAVSANAFPAPEPEPLNVEEVKALIQKHGGKFLEKLMKGKEFLKEQLNKLKAMAGAAAGGNKERDVREAADLGEWREEREAPDLKPSKNADYIVIELPKPQVHYFAAEVEKEPEEAEKPAPPAA